MPPPDGVDVEARPTPNPEPESKPSAFAGLWAVLGGALFLMSLPVIATGLLTKPINRQPLVLGGAMLLLGCVMLAAAVELDKR